MNQSEHVASLRRRIGDGSYRWDLPAVTTAVLRRPVALLFIPSARPPSQRR